MIKTLILMRHGEAAPTPAGGDDFNRALTGKGEAMAFAQAGILIKKNLNPHIILCSAATRTQQTLAQVQEGWQGAIAPKVEVLRELYHATTEDVIGLVKKHGAQHDTVMIIGHNPTIHQLALGLCMPGEHGRQPDLKRGYPPGSISILQFDALGWDEIGPGKASLIDYVMPAA